VVVEPFEYFSDSLKKSFDYIGAFFPIENRNHGAGVKQVIHSLGSVWIFLCSFSLRCVAACSKSPSALRRSMYAARISPEFLHIPNKDLQEASFFCRGTAVSKVKARAAFALPSGTLRGISKTSRWSAGISTVCSIY
jgi:hypothetical protein